MHKAPFLRLAVDPRQGLQRILAPPAAPHHLLVSYAALGSWSKLRHRIQYRTWSLDSGAFSAWNRGVQIDLEEYIDYCLLALEEDPSLIEVIALDVIGDWRAGVKNYERMWAAKVPAIPTFHYGEPPELLDDLKTAFPWKLCVGGATDVRGNEKIHQAGRLLKRIWPMRVHGLGFGDEVALKALPFHSTDSTSWRLQPQGFGLWKQYGRLSLRLPNKEMEIALRSQLEHYARVQRECETRWATEMAELELACPAWPLRRLPA